MAPVAPALALHHLALRSPQPEALSAFYVDLFHLPIVRRQPHGLWLGLGSAVLMIERAGPDEPPVSPQDLALIAFAVTPEDQVRLRARLAERGVTVESETAWTLYFRDPDGRRLGVSTYPLPTTETRVLTATGAPGDEAVAEAAARLRLNQVVAFPTETVYGLGGNALDAEAVARIFAAKARPADNPLIVHVADLDGVWGFAEVDDRARALAEAFWPGPLSMVLPLRAGVMVPAAAGLNTVAVRVPAHPVALALVRAAGVPIAAPSANRSGRPSPTTAAHVLADLGGRIPLIVDGGPCTLGIESTVVGLFADGVRVLRPGAIAAEAIADVLGTPVGLEVGSRQAPGTRHPHYRPRAPVILVSPHVSEAALADLHAAIAPDAGRICTRSRPAAPHRFRPDAAALARHLYADLRDLEGAPLILVEGLHGAAAVMERLGRAASQTLHNDAEAAWFVVD